MRLTMSAAASGAAVLSAFFLAAIPQIAFAQSDPFIGIWKLNLAKSTYKPGPPPRSVTVTTEAVGQGLRSTVEVIDAQGMPIRLVVPTIYDGQPHPSTGSLLSDATSALRTDAHTVEYANTKAGSLVETITMTLSMDGRTVTVAFRGLDPAGQRIDDTAVLDKQ